MQHSIMVPERAVHQKEDNLIMPDTYVGSDTRELRRNEERLRALEDGMPGDNLALHDAKLYSILGGHSQPKDSVDEILSRYRDGHSDINLTHSYYS